MPSNKSPDHTQTNTFTSVEKKKKKEKEEDPQPQQNPTISAILDDEEDYNSEEDSDFAPGVDEEDDDGNDSDSDDSSRQSSPKPASAKSVTAPPPPPPTTTITTTVSEESVTNPAESITKPQTPKDENDKDADDDFEVDPADELDDETVEGGAEDTGPGGEIKTRAQRAKEQETRKDFKTAAPIAVSSSVDSLWASMKSSWRPLPSPSEATATPPPPTPTAAATEDEPTYIFAGEVVSKSSSSNVTTKSTSSKTLTPTTTNKVRRPKRRASVFDTDGPTQSKAKKLNTLEKSKLDWIGFTKTEGLEEELEKHGKGGKGYVERQEFLERVGRRVGK